MSATLSRLWDVFFVALLLFVVAAFMSAAIGPTTALNAWMLGVFTYSPMPWTSGMPTGIRRFLLWSAGVLVGLAVVVVVRTVGFGGFAAWVAADMSAPVVAKKLASLVGPTRR
jgi:hypothetical protein